MKRIITVLLIIGFVGTSLEASKYRLFKKRCYGGSCGYKSYKPKCKKCTNSKCHTCVTKYGKGGKVAYGPSGYDDKSSPPELAIPTPTSITLFAADVDKSKFDKWQASALSWVNYERKKVNLPPIKLSERLCDKASSHARWMAKNMATTNSARIPVGLQNVGSGQRSVADFVRGIAITPEARERLLNGPIREMGFSWAKDANGRFYFVNVYDHQPNSA